ncbi:uncharacterized protein LOC110269772 [Arachis ipaensis]|uniref:uncharacterized protein LOC110269772 n=1 Tax=Arachis ipaensis TaxID=130454 RepID=UPI000A2B0D2D|nr:uncharacterized protein LOC110269772 [Arachis ipaensis]
MDVFVIRFTLKNHQSKNCLRTTEPIDWIELKPGRFLRNGVVLHSVCMPSAPPLLQTPPFLPSEFRKLNSTKEKVKTLASPTAEWSEPLPPFVVVRNFSLRPALNRSRSSGSNEAFPLKRNPS